MRREEETQAALEAALVENKRLRAEIELLKNPPAGHSAPVPESASNDSGAFLCPPSAGISEVTPPADKAAKVALFRSLFRGREDVYAERWRMKNGDWGYRPAGLKNWESWSSPTRSRRGSVALVPSFPSRDPSSTPTSSASRSPSVASACPWRSTSCAATSTPGTPVSSLAPSAATTSPSPRRRRRRGSTGR